MARSVMSVAEFLGLSWWKRGNATISSPTQGISIPRRVRAVATLILAMVVLMAAMAGQAIYTLGESSSTLLEVGIPLQREILRIREIQNQAEFYRSLGNLLPGKGYKNTANVLLVQEQQHLRNIFPDLGQYPTLATDLANLQEILHKYAGTFTPEAGAVLRIQVDRNFHRLRSDLVTLLQTQARQANSARRHAIWLLGLLVTMTALLALLIPWRVAVTLSRPLRNIRAALERIGAGHSTQVAETGPLELRELAAGIAQMQQRLKEDERLRHVFLSQVSHELKTPLASAYSGSELLLSERLGPIGPKQREVLEIVSRQVHELILAIQEMLDMHALQARRLEYHVTALEVDTVLVELERRMIPLLGKKGQQLVISSSGEILVLADPQRLLQILANLVSNSYKYAPPSSSILVSAIADRDGALFSVQDEGPGIPEALQEKVFEDFYQVHRAGDIPKGTGLGLSIARELVRAQGGWIRLQNLSKGLLGQFWLPGPRTGGQPDG